MSAAMIIVMAVAAHVAIALVVARVAYGRARIWILSLPRTEYDIGWSNRTRAGVAGCWLTLGCLAGFWPLVLAAGLVMMKPPKTRAELQEQMKAQQRHIADLERELGISR